MAASQSVSEKANGSWTRVASIMGREERSPTLDRVRHRVRGNLITWNYLEAVSN